MPIPSPLDKASCMTWKLLAEKDGPRWGILSFFLCISIYVVGFTLKYDWELMVGGPFVFFYMFALFGGIGGIPILLIIQCFKMGSRWTKKRTVPLDQVILFLLSTILYGALFIFGKKVWDW